MAKDETGKAIEGKVPQTRKVSEKSLQNLKPQFSATHQPKRNGRKPSVLKKYIRDNGLSAADINAVTKFILPKTQAEIRGMLTDEDVPFLVRLFCRALLEDMKRGNTSNVMSLLDRAFGKPVSVQEIKGLELPQFIGFVSAGDGDGETSLSTDSED